MNRAEIERLLVKYRQGASSPEEERLLHEWFANEAEHSKWEWQDQQQMLQMKARIKQVLDKQIYASSSPKRLTPIYRYAAAAAALLFLTIGLWYFLETDRGLKHTEASYANESVTAGSNAAILVLEDGTSLRLNDTDDPLEVTKAHRNTRKALKGEHKRTIHVPKGGNFQLTLSDGTKVWMNAQSSLTYPLSFDGKTREVSLLGEAYFEVAKDVQKPFKVQSKGDLILVTGTKFNLKAYPDEPTVAVALLEGGVNLLHEESIVSVKPGQQAVSRLGESHITCTNIDIESEIAWRNGYFVFDNQDITAVMNSLARWYNVEINFVDPPSSRKFNGTFAKSRSLEEVLNFLTKVSDIRFEQKEGRVYVMH
ncbi:FecR domain-containing protein [Olivibacter sp. SDN3]|uniref:FecR family protein n=1 Tax=Olivibacter sp. SDN3 TaxID=2764720 RepID=UPI0016517B32|nr:FecR domain-containing protein [Olivibacter sp. SDN3]QNL51908.1 FecR domain-containing protein [Olivibacter sp. SDN3]